MPFLKFTIIFSKAWNHLTLRSLLKMVTIDIRLLQNQYYIDIDINSTSAIEQNLNYKVNVYI